MLCHDLRTRGLSLRAGVCRVHVVQQLRDHHRGRGFALVALRAAGVGDVERVAGGEQALQKELAIIIAARTVAGPRLPAHEVEAERAILARKRGVAHAEQADHAKGHAAHRLQGAERGAPGEEAEAGVPVLDHRLEMRMGDFKGNFGRMVRLHFPELLKGAAQLTDGIGGFVPIIEEDVQKLAERRLPEAERARLGEGEQARGKLIAEMREVPQQFRQIALDIRCREDAFESAAPVAAQRVAEEEAIEPGPPGVLFHRREIKRTAMRGFDAPANAIHRDPLADRGELAFLQAGSAAGWAPLRGWRAPPAR